MKTNIKKIAVFAVVVAIAMFMMVASASADGNKWKNGIQGKYAFTGTGNCAISPSGFGANYIPTSSDGVSAVTQIWDGVYTFDGHGSGSMRATVRSVDLPSYTIETANVSWKFQYKMTDGDRFQTSLVPGTYDKVEWTGGPNCTSTGCATIYFDLPGTWEGVVGPDGESINITGGPLLHTLCDPGLFPPCSPIPVQAYCSMSHVGLLVRE